MVRAFTGHRSNCSAVEFHPFGEFLASGSSDTNLRVWDTRKKGCIQTYKGHTRGISTIEFSPDGRWVVSGGLDNVVKVRTAVTTSALFCSLMIVLITMYSLLYSIGMGFDCWKAIA